MRLLDSAAMAATRPDAYPSPRGRPVATTHDEIERVAFRLFAERGYEGTTLDAIAAEIGVGRRTLFRYFESKNDIPWGQFALTLDGFRDVLAAMPDDLPLHEAVHRGVVAFNDFDPAAVPPHRDRMRLILDTPALQAHSVLKYAEWRSVIADFVARRTGTAPVDPLPETVSQVSLALALSAYTLWLRSPGPSLHERLDEAMSSLRLYLDA